MKISPEFPPNYTLLQMTFPNLGEELKPIFCYGDIIYNPFNKEITKDLEIHEEVHSLRQGDNPDHWWQKYLIDKEFRLEEEIMAYGTQYAFVKNLKMKTEVKDWMKESMAHSLASDYGLDISYGQAESKIRNYANNL